MMLYNLHILTNHSVIAFPGISSESVQKIVLQSLYSWYNIVIKKQFLLSKTKKKNIFAKSRKQVMDTYTNVHSVYSKQYIEKSNL